MSKFIKYLGLAHINSVNVALYDSGAVRAENVVNGRSIGARQFASVDAADEWFDGLSDDGNTTNTVRAIEVLSVQN